MRRSPGGPRAVWYKSVPRCNRAHIHDHSTTHKFAEIKSPTIEPYTSSMTNASASSTARVSSGALSDEPPSAGRSTGTITLKYSADTDYGRDQFFGSPRITISGLSSDVVTPSASAMLKKTHARLLETETLRNGSNARKVLARGAKSALKATLMENGFTAAGITLEYDQGLPGCQMRRASTC